ncbi:MAG: hypothetical protein K2L87_07150, partial [Clostridiales bacterium]|nr:hypothetical protein [Clostridiales bacterium]
MNKKFAMFFSGYGMTIEGNSAYGVIKGYETTATVAMLDSRSPLKMHISFYATDEQKSMIEQKIRSLA